MGCNVVLVQPAIPWHGDGTPVVQMANASLLEMTMSSRLGSRTSRSNSPNSFCTDATTPVQFSEYYMVSQRFCLLGKNLPIKSALCKLTNCHLSSIFTSERTGKEVTKISGFPILYSIQFNLVLHNFSFIPQCLLHSSCHSIQMHIIYKFFLVLLSIAQMPLCSNPVVHQRTLQRSPSFSRKYAPEFMATITLVCTHVFIMLLV